MGFLRKCLFICSFAAALPCAAAEFFYMDHDPFTDKYIGPVGPLVISGDITVGDYERLLAKIRDDQNRFLDRNRVIVASDTGDAAEALKIANLLKSLFTEVLVGPRTGKCIGACFLIYAAATQRGTDGEHLIGIHRLEAAAGADAAGANGANQVRLFLQANLVPDTLLTTMFRRSANDPYYLSADDEAALGSKSPEFKQYLSDKCGWDDSVEQEVYSRKRPMADLQTLLACRARATKPFAQKALAAAIKAQH